MKNCTMILMCTVLVMVLISNVGAGPGLFSVFTDLSDETLKEVSSKSSIEVARSFKFGSGPKCRTVVHRLAWICAITVHYQHHEEVKLTRLNIPKLDRAQIRNALCPCPQGNIAPFCPKFITNFLSKYRHEVICADDYDLEAPLI